MFFMARLHSPGRLRKRWLALPTVLATVALMLTPMAASAVGPVGEGSPADRAAEWIAREYRAPDSEIALYGTGVLIDAMISLAAVGTEPAVALDMLDDLHDAAADYVGTGPTFDAGAAGKVMLAVNIYGGNNVAGFLGFDIEPELRSSMHTDGANVGQFGDAFTAQQAMAILGLIRTEDGVPAEAVEYLASLQCPSGEFTFDAVCPGAGDADTTGIVVLALTAAGDTDTAATSVAWLKSIQQDDGAIPGWGTANTNSTAAAAQAFVAAGEREAAESAAAFLESMQFPQTAGEDAGGLRWLPTDTAANTFATVQGVWGLGVEALFDIRAPHFEFSDTGDSVFYEEIDWIAAAGITRGCDPLSNDLFCPEDPVTRGQMAAFLNRALDLPPASGSGFTDIGSSVFVGDIEAIAAAGITRGCNPPANDMYCPYQLVTREQMAAFLYRALHG
jgi:hypothetical protein